MKRLVVAALLAFAVAGCVREVILSPAPDAGDPDADHPDAISPDISVLPDAAITD